MNIDYFIFNVSLTSLMSEELVPESVLSKA